MLGVQRAQATRNPVLPRDQALRARYACSPHMRPCSPAGLPASPAAHAKAPGTCNRRHAYVLNAVGRVVAGPGALLATARGSIRSMMWVGRFPAHPHLPRRTISAYVPYDQLSARRPVSAVMPSGRRSSCGLSLWARRCGSHSWRSACTATHYPRNSKRAPCWCRMPRQPDVPAVGRRAGKRVQS
jgi:hypothetical protein